MLVAVWATQENSPDHPITSKTVKLQTRTIHQIENTIFIELFKDDPSRQEYWSGVPLPSLIEYYSESKKKKTNRMVFGCRMVVCVWLVYPPATVIAGQTRSHGTMREYHTAEH